MWLDMRINAKKSACIRFGQNYDTDCFQLVTASGDIIDWVHSIRYLGIYFVSGMFLKCNWDHASYWSIFFCRNSYVFNQKQMYTCPYLWHKSVSNLF